MGRHARPVELAIYNNNSGHRTKKVIKERLAAEKKMKIGNDEFIVTQKILDNKVALCKWNELVEQYKDIDFVTSIDIGSIEKYCLTHAEYYELLECKIELEKKIKDKLKLYHAIDELNLDQNINKKLDMLIKLEDRLFLNPLSRIKSVPIKPEEKPASRLEQLGFGNV
jgi:phage terminase small subunit